jgi:hypothetical protein
VRDARAFLIESAHAGPFVTVLTLSGPVQNGAQEKLRAQLDAPDIVSQRVVVDMTEATLYDSWPFVLLANERRRFESAGGALVVVSGKNATVEPFVDDAALPGLRWFSSLHEAMVELLGDIVERAGWSTELPDSG